MLVVGKLQYRKVLWRDYGRTFGIVCYHDVVTRGMSHDAFMVLKLLHHLDIALSNRMCEYSRLQTQRHRSQHQMKMFRHPLRYRSLVALKKVAGQNKSGQH